jgi:hypothetical protein
MLVYVTNCWVGGGWGEIVIPMPEALSFAESRRQKMNLLIVCSYKQKGDILTLLYMLLLPYVHYTFLTGCRCILLLSS